MSAALKRGDTAAAAKAKAAVEERQREEMAARASHQVRTVTRRPHSPMLTVTCGAQIKWEPSYFRFDARSKSWIYKDLLS